MPINKVVFGNSTLLDLSTKTLSSASQLESGVTAYDRAGNVITGTLVVDQTYSITKTLTNVTSSNNDTKVIAGNSFYADLTPTSGYLINNITVTMGGVDVTSLVFAPGTGTKSITANGTYTASNDSLSGYSSVSVNVPSSQASLGTKTITANGTYSASSDSLDGYSEVTANVPNTYASGDEGKVVSNGALVSQSSSTVMQNGTVDTTLINSLTVNVSGSSVDWDAFNAGTWPTGDVVLSSSITTISMYKYIGRTGITSVSAPGVTSVKGGAFRGCTGLTSISFPNVTSAEGDSFRETKIPVMHFPLLTAANTAFCYMQCTEGTILVLPSLATVGGDGLRGSKIAVMDCGSSFSSIPTRCFYGTASTTFYNTLIFRKADGVVSVANANGVDLLGKDSSHQTTIYIPKALYDHLDDGTSLDYKAATNWSTIASRITWAKIEGSIYETKYADGTTIPTS